MTCSFPHELRTAVEQQLFAQYPDCKIDFLHDDAAESCSPNHQHWAAELHLRPDIFPIKRYAQFVDAMNPGAPGLILLPQSLRLWPERRVIALAAELRCPSGPRVHDFATAVGGL